MVLKGQAHILFPMVDYVTVQVQKCKNQLSTTNILIILLILRFN